MRIDDMKNRPYDIQGPMKTCQEEPSPMTHTSKNLFLSLENLKCYNVPSVIT